jgi:hypothetical protein
MIIRAMTVSAAVFALAACSGIATLRDAGRIAAYKSQAGLTASAVDAAGRLHGVVVTRRYQDRFLVDGKDVYRDVEYGWDYEQGTAVFRVFDTDGNLLVSETRPNESVSLAPEERARVEALVRGYPDLAAAVNQPGDVTFWAGGFVYRSKDDRYCGEGSRCVRAIVSKDGGYTEVAHAVVDLMRDRVVYPFYKPAGDPVADTSKKTGKQL